jgi:protein-L-isoaspartate(D-aspartate) O-methyltransferase
MVARAAAHGRQNVAISPCRTLETCVSGRFDDKMAVYYFHSPSPKMNIEQARFNMIEQQIRPWDVLDQDVLNLLQVVKREDFVPAAYKNLAFVDTEIPLPGGENMLAPRVEARLLQEAGLKKHENVLEIGTGSGYMAALLAYKGRYVTSVEVLPELKELAEKNLAANGVSNVTVELGNGAQGWAKAAPYDVIVISGSLPVLPEAFLQQIKVGGRIVAIVGEGPYMTAQLITRVSDSAYDTKVLFETSVKPLAQATTPSHFTF